MRITGILLVLLTLISGRVLANVYTIDVSEKVINFGSYCKKGRISIFVISEHGCIPCEACKKHLKDQQYDMKLVDIYFCVLSKSIEDLRSHRFESRPSNKMWSYLEGCTTPPYIYIFGPTRNPVSIMTGYEPDKIDNNMDQLLDAMKYYRANLVDDNKNAKVSNDTIAQQQAGEKPLPAKDKQGSKKSKNGKKIKVDGGGKTKNDKNDKHGEPEVPKFDNDSDDQGREG